MTSGAVASVWLMPTGELHAAAVDAAQAAAQTAAQDKYTVLTPDRFANSTP